MVKNELNVLIIDDSDEDAILVMRELTRFYSAIHERVKNTDELSWALGKRKWDIVICDYIIPGFSAFAAMEIVRKYDPDIPFIVVSGKVEEEIAVEVMKAGACDYVLKDKLGRLQSVVKRELDEAEVRRKHRTIQRELEDVGQWYKDICENANDLIFVARPDAAILYANPSFGRITGYTQEELQGIKFGDLIHPESAELWQSFMQRVEESGRTERLELALRTKMKDTIYVEGDCGVRKNGGRELQLRGIMHDITESKKSAEIMGKYREIVNSSSEYISLVSEDYVYEAVNDAYCGAQGLPRDRIVGRTVADIWGRKLFDSLLKHNIDECFRGKKIKYREWFEFPSTGKKYHEVLMTPYYEKERVRNAVIITRDLTDMEKAEAKNKLFVGHLALFTKSASDFAGLKDGDSVLKYTATYIKELLPGAVVIVCGYAREERAMSIKSILGLGDGMQKIAEVLGGDFIKDSYRVDQMSEEALSGGRLYRVKGGVHEVSFGKIPKVSAKMIERIFGVSDAYAVGLAVNGVLYGDIKIFIKDTLDDEKTAIIELFAFQAASAMRLAEKK